MLPIQRFKISAMALFTLFVGLATGAFGQTKEQPSVYVRHIDQAIYPPLATAAGAEGTVKLKLKISPAGEVLDAVPLSDDSMPKPLGLLVWNSTMFAKAMTFGCFNCVPGEEYEHLITFVYKLGGPPRSYRSGKIVMDLPDTVTLFSNPMLCDHCPSVAPSLSFIEPGKSVGLLTLGIAQDVFEKVSPLRVSKEFKESYPDCEPRTEMNWVEPDGGGGVNAYVRNGTVFQIESMSRRYSTAEGITVNSSPSQVKRHYKALDAYVLDPSGGQDSDFHDLNYWVSRQNGIGFEFAYSPKKQRRAVSKVIVFEPGTEFFPEGCIAPAQRWFEAPRYSFFDK